MLNYLINAWPALLIAFLLGFVLSWLWEILFWRRRRIEIRRQLGQDLSVQLQAELQDREARLTEIEARLQEQKELLEIERERLVRALESSQNAQARIAELEEELRKAHSQARPSTAPTPVPARPASSSPEPVSQPTSVASGPRPEPPQEPPVTDETPPEPAARPADADDLTEIKGIGPSTAAQLYAAGITKFEQLASMSEVALARALNRKEWKRGRYQPWIDEARRFAHGGPPFDTAEPSDTPDNLAVIRGIGESIEQRLYNAGITNFRQLASLTPEQLAEIVGRRGEFARWIEEARQRAQGK